MPFGARRFTQLVYHEELLNGSRVGVHRARFVPFALDGPEELLDESTLRRELDDNLKATRCPLPDAEEQLALRAFVAQARGKNFSRAAVESVAARGQQRVIVDVLDDGERAIIERFRKLLALQVRPQTVTHDNTNALISSRYDFADSARDVLRILDKYLSRPKGI